MNTFLVIAAGILGLIIGSFLNVVILRINTGMGIGGRSKCFSCGKTLRWYELIPVLSFIIQKGRCRKCGSKISWQYPLVEFMTGVLFAGVMISFLMWGTPILLWFGIVSLGVVISGYDILHTRILWYPLLALVVLTCFVGIHILGIFEIAGPFFLLWALSRGQWIGFGDIELLAVIGLGLGLLGGYSAVFLGFWIACLVVLPIALYYKIHHRKLAREIPLGPFLLLGFYLVAVLHLDVLSFILKMVH